MSLIEFQGTSIELDLSDEYVFLLSTKEASKCFGCSADAIRQSKSHNQHELIESKHSFTVRNSNNAKKIMWTKRGIVHLGFFIKSKCIKEFRKWATNYVIDGQIPNSEYQHIIIFQNEQIVQIGKEINRLKGTLIKLHTQLEKASNILAHLKYQKYARNLNTENNHTSH